MNIEQKYDQLRLKGWVRNPSGTRWQKGFFRILQSDVEELKEDEFLKLLTFQDGLASKKK